MSDDQTTSELVKQLRDADAEYINAPLDRDRRNMVLSMEQTSREAAGRLEALQARVDALEAEIARRDESYGCDGCSTGDCPHDTVQECADAMSKIIQEQSATIAGLQSRVMSLERECYRLWGALGGIQTDVGFKFRNPKENTMSKYKVGDRVRVTVETYVCVPAGSVGVVTEVRQNGAVFVDSEDWPSRHLRR
jgi:hypothetical protein